MVDFVEKDIYGRGADIIFGKGAAELTKRQALLKLKAIRDAKSQIKPGEYIEYDLYGRGDPRIFGKNAHIANYEQAAKELVRRQRPDRFSLRKAIHLPSKKVRKVLKLLKKKSLSESVSEGQSEEDGRLVDTSHSGLAVDKNQDGLTEEIQYANFHVKGSSAHLDASPARESHPGTLTSMSSADSPEAMSFVSRVINIKVNRRGGMQAVLAESFPQTDVAREVHAQEDPSLEHSVPIKLETNSEPVRDVIAVSGLRKLFELHEDAEPKPIGRASSFDADSKTPSRSKSACSRVGSLDHDNNSSARIRIHRPVSTSDDIGVSSHKTNKESSNGSINRIKSKSIGAESSIEYFGGTKNSWENEASETDDFSFSRKESENAVERPRVPVCDLASLFDGAHVATSDQNDGTRSGPDDVLENSRDGFLATRNEFDSSKTATEEAHIIPTSVSALSKLFQETRELDEERNGDSATYSSQNIRRYESASEHRDQTSLDQSFSRALDGNTEDARDSLDLASNDAKDSSQAVEPSPVSLSVLAKLFSGTADGDKDKNRESVSHSLHESVQPDTTAPDGDSSSSFEMTAGSADPKPDREGSTSSSSGPVSVHEDFDPVVEISSSSESTSVPIRHDDNLDSWSSDLVEPVDVSDNASLDFATLGLDETAVLQKQHTSCNSSSESEVEALDSVPQQKTAASPHGSNKDVLAKIVDADALEPAQQEISDEGLPSTSAVKSKQSSVFSSKGEQPPPVIKTKSKGFWERLFGYSKSAQDTNEQSVNETASARDLADSPMQVFTSVPPDDEKTGSSSAQDLAQDVVSEEKRYSCGAGPSSMPHPAFGSGNFDSKDPNATMEHSSSSTRSEAVAPNRDQMGSQDRSEGQNSPRQFPRGKSGIKRADTLLDVRKNSAAREYYEQTDSQIMERSSSIQAADHVTVTGREHSDAVHESAIGEIEPVRGHSRSLSKRKLDSGEVSSHVNTVTTDSSFDSVGSSDEFDHADGHSGAHRSGESDSGERSSHLNAVTTDSGYDSVGSSDEYI